MNHYVRREKNENYANGKIFFTHKSLSIKPYKPNSDHNTQIRLED